MNAALINGVHINADAVRERYKDWDLPEGRLRQAQRMRHLADGVVMAGKGLSRFCLSHRKSKTRIC